MKIYIVYDRNTYYENIGSILSVWSEREFAENYIKHFKVQRAEIDEIEIDAGLEIVKSCKYLFTIDAKLNLETNEVKIKRCLSLNDIGSEYIRLYETTKKFKHCYIYTIALNKEEAIVNATKLIKDYESEIHSN